MSKRIFVTGTGTDVGKTYISGLLVKKLHQLDRTVAYYKAAMSGNQRDELGQLIPGDAVYIKEVSGIHQAVETMCPYVYEAALSPHLASRIEGNPLNMEVVLKGLKELEKDYNYVVMEGSGGILCPLLYDEEEIWLTDVLQAANVSCVLVADAGLGTINHVGLSAFYMKEKKIPLKGIIFNRFDSNNPMHLDNLNMCEALTGVKVLACVEDGAEDLNLPLETLRELFEEEV